MPGRWLARRGRAVVIALLSGFLAAPVALAQDDGCEPPLNRGPVEVTPAVRASNVTLGAPVRVRYTPGYFEDPLIGADPASSVSLVHEETGAPVSGRVVVYGDILVFLPDGPLQPRSTYVGRAESVDALAALDFQFTTGASFDLSPPSLGNVTGMTATYDGESCEAPDGGYRIDVTFEPAFDDGPPGDIEYFLYVSRGPEVEAPELRARARNVAPSEVVMAFVAEPSEIASDICVAVQAVDGVGNVSEATAVRCDDPIKGNYFEPACSVSPWRGANGGNHSAALVVGVLLGVLCVRRRLRA